VTARLAAGSALVVSLDSLLNMALPAITAAFGVPPEAARWIIVGYVLTYAVTAFLGGAAADLAGHGRVLRAGLALTALGVLVAGLAPALGWLVLARVVQGLGGGLVYGTAPALVAMAGPPSARGRALGTLNAAIGLGLTAGPLVAGPLLDALGWRAVFLARVPLAAVLLVWTLALPPLAAAAGPSRLVAPGDLVQSRVLHAGGLALLANAGIFAVWLLAPFYLLGTRGLDAVAGGLLFMLTPLGTTVASPLAGRIADRLGPALPVAVGLLVEATGLLVLSRADATTPVTLLAVALFAAGLGLGLFQVPNMTAVMGAFGPGQQGAAGGFSFLARTLGVVAGVLGLGQVFAWRRVAVGATAAFAEAFVVAAGAVALAAAISLIRPGAGRPPRTRPGRTPRAPAVRPRLRDRLTARADSAVMPEKFHPDLMMKVPAHRAEGP
jgi:MFS family permease